MKPKNDLFHATKKANKNKGLQGQTKSPLFQAIFWLWCICRRNVPTFRAPHSAGRPACADPYLCSVDESSLTPVFGPDCKHFCGTACHCELAVHGACGPPQSVESPHHPTQDGSRPIYRPRDCRPDDPHDRTRQIGTTRRHEKPSEELIRYERMLAVMRAAAGREIKRSPEVYEAEWGDQSEED